MQPAAAVWRSCYSRRKAAESSKQRRPGQVSSAAGVRARPLLKSLQWLPVQQRIQ